MTRRFTRRVFVGRLARASVAIAGLGVLAVGAGRAEARTVGGGVAGPPASTAGPSASAATGQVAGTAVPGAGAADSAVLRAVAIDPAPVSVRMADLRLEGRELRAGLLDGVRAGRQGGDGAAGALTAERAGGTYTTPALQAAFPCSHVGVHWLADGGDQAGLTVAVRASRDGQTWMPWRAVRPEAHGRDAAGSGPSIGGVRTFGGLVGGRLAAWFQVRLTFERAGPDVAAIRALTVTCLDSRRPAVGTAPHPPGAASQADVVPRTPTIGSGEAQVDQPGSASAVDRACAQGCEILRLRSQAHGAEDGPQGGRFHPPGVRHQAHDGSALVTIDARPPEAGRTEHVHEGWCAGAHGGSQDDMGGAGGLPLSRARERGAGGEGRFPGSGEGRASALDVLRAGVTGFLDRVVSREAWGADESLRFKDGDLVWPTAFVAPSLLVVHHTATDTDYTDAEAEVRAIYAYHAVTQGWGDIGYHLLIDSSGRVYEGRRGREPDVTGAREIVSADVVAGHALDYNYGSSAVALLGNFQERVPGTAMLEALTEALAFQASRYRIDPEARITYTRSRGDGTALWRDGLAALSGHRDCIATECPGDNVYALLPRLRGDVAALLGPVGPAVAIRRGPPTRGVWPGTDLVFEWDMSHETAEVSVRLEGWRRADVPDRIIPLSGYTDDERPVWGPWTRRRELSVPLPSDARGLYALQIRARDAAGQEGRAAARAPFVVDRHVFADDADVGRADRQGDWIPSASVLGYNGFGYASAPAGATSYWLRWRLDVPEAGTYRVQACWTEAPDRTVRAAYRVSQGGRLLGQGTANQQDPGGRWVDVAEVELAAGSACAVELSGAADGVVVADAVRLALR